MLESNVVVEDLAIAEMEEDGLISQLLDIELSAVAGGEGVPILD